MNLLTSVQQNIRTKLPNMASLKEYLNLNTYSNLDEKSLLNIIEFFMEEHYEYNKVNETLELSHSAFGSMDTIKSKIKLVDDVVTGTLDYLNISKSDYELNFKILSYLVYRELKGGE